MFGSALIAEDALNPLEVGCGSGCPILAHGDWIDMRSRVTGSRRDVSKAGRHHCVHRRIGSCIEHDCIASHADIVKPASRCR